MSNSKMTEILQQLANGEMSVEQATAELSLTTPINDLEFATVDHQRSERIGFPEVVYGLSKTPKDTADIAERIFANEGVVLVTKSSKQAFKILSQTVPEAVWEEGAQAIWADRREKKNLIPGVRFLMSFSCSIPQDRWMPSCQNGSRANSTRHSRH